MNRSIHYQSDLKQAFRQLVLEDKRVSWTLDEASFGLSLQFDTHLCFFAPIFVVSPTFAHITDALQSSAPNRPRPLLVVPRLSTSLLQACRKRELSVIDLNGRTYLRSTGLLIELDRLPNREFRFEAEPKNVFRGKSARIVRTLLAEPNREWSQAQIVDRTEVTQGLVSRILNHLVRHSLLRKLDSRRYVVASPKDLLEAWENTDDFGQRNTTYRFSSLDPDLLVLSKKLQTTLSHHGIRSAFTQWIAAWHRIPYTDLTVTSLYVPYLPSSDILDKLDLHPVADVGRVWFHIPSDEGVFRETQERGGLSLVCDAQIYLDLQKTGLRGQEQAKALLEWPGFLLP